MYFYSLRFENKVGTFGKKYGTINPLCFLLAFNDIKFVLKKKNKKLYDIKKPLKEIISKITSFQTQTLQIIYLTT